MQGETASRAAQCELRVNPMIENNERSPATYRQNSARYAEKLMLIGATRAELALFFGVDVATIERWAEEHKDFEWALQTMPTTLGGHL